MARRALGNHDDGERTHGSMGGDHQSGSSRCVRHDILDKLFMIFSFNFLQITYVFSRESNCDLYFNLVFYLENLDSFVLVVEPPDPTEPVTPISGGEQKSTKICSTAKAYEYFYAFLLI